MQASADPIALAYALRELEPLNERERSALLKQGRFLRLEPGELLYRENQDDANVHYLLDGGLALSWKGRAIRSLNARPPAQSEALDRVGQKLYTVHARIPSVVLRIPRSALEQSLQAHDHEPSRDAATLEPVGDADKSQSWMVLLLRSDIFAHLPASNVQQIFDRIESIQLAAGEEVVRRGEPAHYYYVIEVGRCEIWRPDQDGAPATHIADLGTGAGFGEEALLCGTPHKATLRMSTAGRLLRLHKRDFDTLIRDALIGRVTLDEARRIVEHGGVWLDIRKPGSVPFELNPEPQSLPLPMLRNVGEDLATNSRYVVISENEGEAAIGAFLLAERGRQASYLAGGQSGLTLRSLTLHAAPALDTASWTDSASRRLGRETWLENGKGHGPVFDDIARVSRTGPGPDLALIDGSPTAPRSDNKARQEPLQAVPNTLQPVSNLQTRASAMAQQAPIPAARRPRSEPSGPSFAGDSNAITANSFACGTPAPERPMVQNPRPGNVAEIAHNSTDNAVPRGGRTQIQEGTSIMRDDEHFNERGRSGDPLGETVIGNSLSGLIDEMQGQLDNLPAVDPTPVEQSGAGRDALAERIAKGDTDMDRLAETAVDSALAKAELDLGNDPQLDEREVLTLMEQHIAAQCTEFEKRVRETIKATQEQLKAQYEKALRARLNQIRTHAVQSLKRELATARSAYALQTAQERQAVRRDYQRLMTLANRIARQKAGINRARGQFEEKLQTAERLQREIFQLREMLSQQLGDLDGIEQEQTIESMDSPQSTSVGDAEDFKPETNLRSEITLADDGSMSDTLEQTEARIRDALDRFNSG